MNSVICTANDGSCGGGLGTRSCVPPGEKQSGEPSWISLGYITTLSNEVEPLQLLQPAAFWDQCEGLGMLDKLIWTTCCIPWVVEHWWLKPRALKFDSWWLSTYHFLYFSPHNVFVSLFKAGRRVYVALFLAHTPTASCINRHIYLSTADGLCRNLTVRPSGE